eukprot:scaffold1224_cov136-Amphora_coffeaeformis.AAC.1
MPEPLEKEEEPKSASLSPRRVDTNDPPLRIVCEPASSSPTMSSSLPIYTHAPLQEEVTRSVSISDKMIRSSQTTTTLNRNEKERNTNKENPLSLPPSSPLRDIMLLKHDAHMDSVQRDMMKAENLNDTPPGAVPIKGPEARSASSSSSSYSTTSETSRDLQEFGDAVETGTLTHENEKEVAIKVPILEAFVLTPSEGGDSVSTDHRHNEQYKNERLGDKTAITTATPVTKKPWSMWVILATVLLLAGIVALVSIVIVKAGDGSNDDDNYNKDEGSDVVSSGPTSDPAFSPTLVPTIDLLDLVNTTNPLPVGPFSSFQSRDKLVFAVDQYMNKGNVSSAIQATYGPYMNMWDVGNLTDFSYLFAYMENFNQDISLWNLGQATTLEGMFIGAIRFNQPIEGWNVSSVTNMAYTFAGATSFNQFIGNWDVRNVVTMESMFGFAPLDNRNIDSIDYTYDMALVYRSASKFDQFIGNWDVSSVTTMESMFHGARSFNQPLEQWNVGGVLTMKYMFRLTDSFSQNLGWWDVSSVEDFEGMFEYAEEFSDSLCNWMPSLALDPYDAQGLCYYDSRHVPMRICENCYYDGAGDSSGAPTGSGVSPKLMIAGLVLMVFGYMLLGC